MARSLLLPALLALSSCAVGRQMLAENGDLADYRAFRVAGHEGVRLARASRYLEAHPSGAWADEVRATFNREEPLYFEASTASRAKTSEYLADLPRGPHAQAAIELLAAFDTHVEDVATARLLRNARHTEAVLERANAQRRAVGEHILEGVSALLDADVYGKRPEEFPEALRRALRGASSATWGTAPSSRSEELFYSVPGRTERVSRLVAIELDVELARGEAVRGVLRGPDLFVSWEEADAVEPRDPTNPADRARAAVHATDVLSGALEAHLPASRCAPPAPPQGMLLVRSCDGWTVAVTQGASPGSTDTLVVTGPRK